MITILDISIPRVQITNCVPHGNGVFCTIQIVEGYHAYQIILGMFERALKLLAKP